MPELPCNAVSYEVLYMIEKELNSSAAALRFTRAVCVRVSGYELYIHIQMLPSCREALITDSQGLW